jgi:RsmE family RNA methyltransferase
MGVGRIILTNACKVERVYFDTHVLQPETYRPLMIDGLQQSQDTQIPEVTIRKQLKILVEDELDILFPYGGRLLADPSAQNRIRDLIFDDPGMRVLVAVGPEGGWTDYERDLLQRHGFRPVSMGQRTLRADTACIAVLALVHEALASVE